MKAADAGDADAQLVLARFCQSGRGVERELDTAIDSYDKAARNGNREAKLILVSLLEQAVLDDPASNYQARATEWHKRLAEVGYGPVQLALGQQYATGVGVKVDLVQAYK